MSKEDLKLLESNKMDIEKAKSVFNEILAIDKKLGDVIPKNNPHRIEIANKCLDLMLRFHFVIDTEAAEIANPVKLGISKKDRDTDGTEQQSH